MSYILDALRKSEQQRKLVRDLKLEHGPDASAPAARRPLWPLVLALLALLGAGIGAYLALQRPAPAPPAPAPAAIPEPPPAAASAPAALAPPAPAAAAGRDPSAPIADLAEHARTAPAARSPAPAPPGAATPAASGARAAPARVPFLREMPTDFVRAIPELIVNIHLYTPEPAQRVIYINNKPVREGEAVADGIYVEAIVEDGVVLHRQGQRFKLPRPQ